MCACVDLWVCGFVFVFVFLFVDVSEQAGGCVCGWVVQTDSKISTPTQQWGVCLCRLCLCVRVGVMRASRARVRACARGARAGVWRVLLGAP